MALKFLNKKGWHTGSLRNIENVWKAEQKHDAEQKKLEELKKQIQEEREKAEFRLIQEQAGLVPKQERLDFLYDSGLAVGKSSTDGFKELETLPKPGNEVASSSSAKPSVPGALFDEKPQSANDTWRKLHSDPLLMIRQREQEALARVRNNPVQMAMIRKSVETKKHKNTGDRKERKKIQERNLEDQRHSSLSPPRDSENATFEKKEKRNKSDKYDEHYSKIKRDSELFDERGGGHRKKDGDKYDEHYSKTKRDSELYDERGGGHRKKDGDKYDEHYSKTKRDSELYDERRGHMKKYDEHYSETKRDSELYDERGGHMKKDGDKYDEHYSKTKRDSELYDERRGHMKKDGDKYDEHYSKTKRDSELYDERRGHMKKDGDKYDEHYSKTKRDSELYDERREHMKKDGDKYDEHYSKTKRDSDLYDERGGHRKKDGGKYDEHYSKTKRDSELFDERGGHRKKDGDKYDEHYSKTKRDSELFDERGGHRKKDGDKDLKYKHNPSRDMSDPETATTDGHGVQRNLEKSKCDKYNYDGQTTSTAPKKYEASSSNHSGVTVQRESQYKRRNTAPKISEEERAARLREMQVDAELHEEQRWKRLKKADEVDANEATKAAGMSGGKNFLDVAHTKVYGAEKGGSSTIEESVRRRTHYSQGRSEATGNAFRR